MCKHIYSSEVELENFIVYAFDKPDKKQVQKLKLDACTILEIVNV